MPALRITDGTTTLTFTSGDMYLADYAPDGADDLKSPMRERAIVGFTNSIATIQSNINTLNRLLFQAEAYTLSLSGPRVYVEFDPTDSGTYWRARLYGGKIMTHPDFLGGEYGAHNIEIDVEWERDPFWEGALTQLPLTNSSASGNTSGITIKNRGEGGSGFENWVSISSTDLDGDLPAAIKIEMTNSTTDSADCDEIFVFHNVYSNPANLKYIIEAESWTSTDSVSTTDTVSSANAYARITWSSSAEYIISQFTISSSDLSDMKGGNFAILLRWADFFPYSDAWMRVKLYTTSTFYQFFKGSLSLINTGRQLTMLETLRLPPYLAGQTALKEILLALTILRTGGGDIKLDFVQLSPIAAGGSWLHFKSVSQGVPAEQVFVHDGTEGFTYRIDASSKWINDFAQIGGPIMLVPGQTQRLIFNTSDYNGAAKPSQSWSVKVYYRPRRVVI